MTSGDDGIIRSIDLESQKMTTIFQWDLAENITSQEILWHNIYDRSTILVGQSNEVFLYDVRSPKRITINRDLTNGIPASVNIIEF